MKLNNHKCWVVNLLQKQIIGSDGFLIETSLKYCVLRGSFFEKSDGLIQNQRTGDRVELKGYEPRPSNERV